VGWLGIRDTEACCWRSSGEHVRRRCYCGEGLDAGDDWAGSLGAAGVAHGTRERWNTWCGCHAGASAAVVRSSAIKHLRLGACVRDMCGVVQSLDQEGGCRSSNLVGAVRTWAAFTRPVCFLWTSARSIGLPRGLFVVCGGAAAGWRVGGGAQCAVSAATKWLHSCTPRCSWPAPCAWAAAMREICVRSPTAAALQAAAAACAAQEREIRRRHSCRWRWWRTSCCSSPWGKGGGADCTAALQRSCEVQPRAHRLAALTLLVCIPISIARVTDLPPTYKFQRSNCQTTGCTQAGLASFRHPRCRRNSLRAACRKGALVYAVGVCTAPNAVSL
jgi:hypothetical protein